MNFSLDKLPEEIQKMTHLADGQGKQAGLNQT